MSVCSDLPTINRGVPQGSVLGPLLFNVFLNKLFNVKMSCEIAHYADDNHLYYEKQCHKTSKGVLENDVNSATTWFENNYMGENPDKVPEYHPEQKWNICTGLYNCIKLTMVTSDYKLKFDKHVSEMCTKASWQINALKRVSKYLDENCRIMIYKTFISSNLNYCLVSWVFGDKTNLNKLETLRERVLRFVFRDTTSSYGNLLTPDDFLSLSVYRIQCLGIEVYKCPNGLNPDYLHNLFNTFRPSDTIWRYKSGSTLGPMSPV